MLGYPGGAGAAAAGPDPVRGVVVRGRTCSRDGRPLPDDDEIRAWDSYDDIVRYLVLPERPPGTEGMTEAELADLVTRDSMIGAARL